MKVNTFQVHKAYRVNVDLPRRPTPALTNQIHDIDKKKNNTKRNRNLDSATTGSPSGTVDFQTR